MKRVILYCFLLILLSRLPLSGQAYTPTINYVDKGTSLFWENIDSSIYYFQEGLVYYSANDQWADYTRCLNALTSCLGIKGNFTGSYAYALQALETAEKHQISEGTIYGSTLNNLAIYARRKGDYEKAISYYQKALAIEQKKGDLANEITLLNNLGKCFSSKGDFYESKRIFNQVLHKGLKEFDVTNLKMSRTYRELASIHQTTGQVDTALFLYHKALDLIAKNKTGEVTFKARQQQEIHLRIADIFFDKQSESAFKNHIEQAIKYAQAAFGREPEYAYLLLGKWATLQKQYDTALKHLNKSLILNEKKYKNLGKHPEIGLIYFHLAQVYEERGDLTKSLLHLQNALQQHSEKFAPNDLQQIPSAEDLVIDQNLLKILQAKAAIELKQYQQDGDKKDLQSSRATYRLAIDMLNKLRQSYLGTGSKEILAKNVLPIFEGALQTTYAQYQAQPSNNLFNEAFLFAENSKAILLLESINETMALGFAGIPNSLQRKEKELKLDIAYHEKQKALTKSSEADKLKAIEEGLFELEEQHRALLHTFEEKYPDYHQLKYGTQIASLETVREKLANSESALIEYFVGEQFIYSFYISEEKVLFKRVAKTPAFQQQVQQVRDLLVVAPSVENAEEDFANFTQATHALYQLLIAPLAIEANIKQINIIPDDLLSYLPFEIFLRELPLSNKINYAPKALTYLLNDFHISYNYSASLFTRRLKNRQQAPYDFVGFAPSFGTTEDEANALRDCTRDHLYSLHCNKEEVQQINALFNGLALTGAAASKTKFQEVIQDYRIAHFATHSCLDDENPMLNKIFLADNYLSNFDLYNLQLSTELAVLSACNTGSGQLRRGEGVMSVSRGFMQAGCPSVLMSLWSVEDCTTSAIMKQYYQGIKAGNSKGLALQQAKLQYLENANKLERHPFYWAAFVQFGEVEAMKFGPTFSFWKWVLLFFFFILLFFWFRK